MDLEQPGVGPFGVVPFFGLVAISTRICARDFGKFNFVLFLVVHPNSLSPLKSSDDQMLLSELVSAASSLVTSFRFFPLLSLFNFLLDAK